MSSSDTPRLAPLSGNARQLVVLVHGYGADGSDLLSLGQHWQHALPDAAFASPNAPMQIPGAPGYQWFPLRTLDAKDVTPGAASAAPGLDAFLDAELKAQGVAPENLVLVGFSQGAMMALYVGLRRKVPPAAILAFSGQLPGLIPQPAPGGHYPPVFISHGDSDNVVPPQLMFLAIGAMQQAGITPDWHLARGVAHGIDPESLELAGQFLLKALGGKP